MDKETENMDFMTSRKLRFAIFGNTYQTKKSTAIREVIAGLASFGAGVCIDREYYDFLKASGMLVGADADVFDGDCFVADSVEMTIV